MNFMNKKDFIKKYTEKTYLGDGLFVSFDGFHIILSAERENGMDWVALEPCVFDQLVDYRKQLYKDHEGIEDEKVF